MVVCQGVKSICNCHFLARPLWFSKRCMQAFAQEYPEAPFMQLFKPYFMYSFFPPPQRHKSTIRRVPTQSALLFSPLRPASCKSLTANWQVRGTQQPRYGTAQKHWTETHAPHSVHFLFTGEPVWWFHVMKVLIRFWLTGLWARTHAWLLTKEVFNTIFLIKPWSPSYWQ